MTIEILKLLQICNNNNIEHTLEVEDNGDFTFIIYSGVFYLERYVLTQEKNVEEYTAALASCINYIDTKKKQKELNIELNDFLNEQKELFFNKLSGNELDLIRMETL